MRTIAEVLAYNRAYSPKLNPNLFDEDNEMYPEVHDKIIEIVDEFMKYAQVEDVKISDIRVVGSNASYNYNKDSDLDVHIVTDLSKISKPETIANLYFTEVKHAFKEAYDITIKGIDVELYVEDVNASAVTNGIYSVSQDKWIKEPTPMDDPTDDDISQAEEIEDEIISALEDADSEEDKEAIIDKLYVMRKDALASVGETAPANLAFKSLRNKGILKRAKDDIKKQISKRLSLESKKMRESKISSRVRGNINTDMKDMVQSMTDAPIGTKIVIKADNRWHDVRSIYEKVGEDTWKFTHQVDGKDSWDTTRPTIATYSDLWNSIYSGTVISESKKMRESILRLKEDLEDAIYLNSKQEMIDYLKGITLTKFKEYAVCTRDDYDFYVFWTRDRLNSPAHPIIQIDYNGDTIFHREGNAGSDELLQQAIRRLEGMRESRRRVREMARTQNKYWIYTEDYSRMKKDERERAEFLMDSDNTSAYGPDDLIYKLNQLKAMNIKVKKIYQTYKNETSTNVTDRYRRYLI